MLYRRRPLNINELDPLRHDLVFRRGDQRAGVCDFCGLGNPSWMYSSSHRIDGREGECWRWVVCSVCSVLIQKDQLDRVEQRAVEYLLQRMPMLQRGIAEEAVLYSFRDFRMFAIREADDDGGKRDYHVPGA